MPGQIEFSGPLVAPGTVVVRAKSNGTLLNLAVGEGSRVKAGQALGQVDLEELRYRIAERGASVEAMRAQMEQAERTHKANEGLAAKNFIAQTALDNSRAAYESARANWHAAKAQLDTSQVTMRQAALVSPINGIVAKRHALPGEKLAAEQQILSIVDLAKLELAGLVGTHEVSRLQPGMAVQVKVEGVDQPVEAKIARIAPSRGAGHALHRRDAGAGQPQGALPRRPVRRRQGRVARRYPAPDGAHRRHQPQLRPGAGVDDREGRPGAPHVVTTGRSDAREGRVEVLNGLKPEAQVLAARFDNLREGDPAQIVAAKSAKVASAAASAAAQAVRSAPCG